MNHEEENTILIKRIISFLKYTIDENENKNKAINRIYTLWECGEKEIFQLKRSMLKDEEYKNYEEQQSKILQESIADIKEAIINGIQKSIRDSINKKIIGQGRGILLRSFISIYQELVGNDFIEIIWNENEVFIMNAIINWIKNKTINFHRGNKNEKHVSFEDFDEFYKRYLGKGIKTRLFEENQEFVKDMKNALIVYWFNDGKYVMEVVKSMEHLLCRKIMEDEYSESENAFCQQPQDFRNIDALVQEAFEIIKSNKLNIYEGYGFRDVDFTKYLNPFIIELAEYILKERLIQDDIIIPYDNNIIPYIKEIEDSIIKNLYISIFGSATNIFNVDVYLGEIADRVLENGYCRELDEVWNGINEQINAEKINIIYSKLQGYYSEKRNNLMDKSLENY